MVRTKNGGPMTEPTAADRLSETLVLPAKGNLLTLAEKGVAKVRADRRDQRTAPTPPPPMTQPPPPSLPPHLSPPPPLAVRWVGHSDPKRTLGGRMANGCFAPHVGR